MFPVRIITVCNHNAQADTGDLLEHNTLKRRIRSIIEQVEREMPRPPDDPQQDHTLAVAKALLHTGLQKVAPAVFFPKKQM